MQAIEIQDAPATSAAGHADCEECIGSGGWYRYEPSAEAGPGLLYLSCLECKGSGILPAALTA